jgi:hypothetical protein
MSFLFNLLQHFEDQVIVWNTTGIEIAAVRQARELAPTHAARVHTLFCQCYANSSLIRLWQTFYKFNHPRCSRAHGSKYNGVTGSEQASLLSYA